MWLKNSLGQHKQNKSDIRKIDEEGVEPPLFWCAPGKNKFTSLINHKLELKKI